MNRALIVHVPLVVRKALLEMSKQDIRDPDDQIRFLIEAEANRRGILPQTNSDASDFVLADSTGIAR